MCVSASTPFAQTTIASSAGRSLKSEDLSCCVGTAQTCRSDLSGRLSLTSMDSGTGKPGNRRFSLFALISAAAAALRVTNATLCPARAAWIASAVPQAPAPITENLLIRNPDHGGPRPALIVTKSIQDRGGDRVTLLHELVRRVDDQNTASVQPIGVGRFAQIEFERDNVADPFHF